MIGGVVVETIELTDRIWVNCREVNKSTRELRGEPCAIYVEKSDAARSISVGDSFWWQSGHAYWTAKNRHGKTVGKSDTKLRRIGYSGAQRPQATTPCPT